MENMDHQGKNSLMQASCNRERIIKNKTRVTTNSEESLFFLWYTSFLTQVKKIFNIEYLRMMPIN